MRLDMLLYILEQVLHKAGKIRANYFQIKPGGINFGKGNFQADHSGKGAGYKTV